MAAALAFTQSLWGADLVREKHPDDLARHEILIERIAPAVVIETGLHWGFGARWLAERVPHVVTIDRDAQMIHDWHNDTHGFGSAPENVAVFAGDSVTRFGDIAHFVEPFGGPVYVILDSDHGTDHVLREMECYGDLVCPGSYMVVEDGIYHYLPTGRRHEGNWYDGDPVLAVDQFLRTHDGWEVDVELEDAFPVTMNPDGYLRRL